MLLELGVEVGGERRGYGRAAPAVTPAVGRDGLVLLLLLLGSRGGRQQRGGRDVKRGKRIASSSPTTPSSSSSSSSSSSFLFVAKVWWRRRELRLVQDMTHYRPSPAAVTAQTVVARVGFARAKTRGRSTKAAVGPRACSSSSSSSSTSTRVAQPGHKPIRRCCRAPFRVFICGCADFGACPPSLGVVAGIPTSDAILTGGQAVAPLWWVSEWVGG